VVEVTDSLGVVCTFTGAKFATRMRPDGSRQYLVELPDRLQDVPDGWIVYLDRDGRVQVMSSEEWTERVEVAGR
jgi:hypothetical protein